MIRVVVKVIIRLAVQLFIGVAAYLGLLWWLDRTPAPIVSTDWQGRAVVVGKVCFTQQGLYRSKQVVTWCRDNGAREFVVITVDNK